MLKFILKKLKKNNKGFTLVELVVVVAILGLLAAIAVPKLTTSRKKAAITAHNANVKTLKNAANMFIAENGAPETNIVTWNPDGGTKASEETGTTDNDKWALYLQEWPDIPDGLEEEDFDGTNVELKYKVTIDNNGDITVTPVLKDTGSDS